MSKWDMDDTGYEEGIKEIKYDVCQILFEGEDTHIGRKITIDRIKEYVNYNKWLEEENEL